MKFLLIGLGGGIGALCRFGISQWLQPSTPGAFPYGTFAANVIGCLAFGVFYGMTAGFADASAELRGFVAVGLLGGFTTYSAFGFETVNLARQGAAGTAVVYVVLSLLLGIAAVWVGMAVAGGSGGK